MNKSTQNTGEQIYMVFYLFGDPLSSLHVYMIVCVYFIHIGILYIIWTIYIYIYSNIYIYKGLVRGRRQLPRVPLATES